MIAGVPDKKIPYWIAETYFEELLMAGVEIYRYKAGFIHCKNIVVDGKVSTMGTCNFDMRSFEINYEINSIFYNEEISQSIRNQFYKDLDFCEEIKEENLKETVFWRKIRNSLFRVVSPLMELNGWTIFVNVIRQGCEMKGNSIFKSDGIVLLNKSRGISSFKAINKLKWIIGSSKVGHAGTLDPIAEGLLIVMINNATKFSDNLMKRDKEYFVELELGYETDTYDIEGEITEKYEGNINISDEKIIEAVNSFAGEIMQVPPMYSAIKINGEKLYELARKGIEVEREARKVKIYSIREINVEHKEKCRISFYTEVSSGTYIRSLVRDIGRKLGVYATMTKLVRTKIDKYSIEESVLLEEIEEKLGKAKETSGENVCKDISNNMEKTKEIIKFKNIECIFNYEKISVSEEKYKKLKNGMTVLVGFKKFKEIHTVTENKLYCIYVKNEMTEQKEFKGIVKVIRKGHDKVYLKREKYFI